MSTKTTDAYVDQTTHELSLREFPEDKNYKEKILKEIIVTICAMLNTNGGKVVINIDGDSSISNSQISLMVRMVEQRLKDIIGTKIISHVDFKEDKETVTIFVKKADSLITVHYHLCLPSQTQVIQVPPSKPQEEVKNEIVNRNAVDEPVQLESHKKIFFENKECGLSETKTVQLKKLKADASKNTTLADRIVGKSNKFSCYVSAFANYNGGHIYYGIDDTGIVAGELIEDEMDKSEIIKKVEKSMNKMIWASKSEQPKRKKHWEIFFEPVFDDNSALIPLTFVIVIYIAPCLGGVFTEDPECYEMVKGKVEKMSFTTWKKRILQPSLPVPDSTCEVFLPVPNSTCVVSLPVPNSTCVVSLPVPNSTCVVFLPVPNSTCVVSLPVPNSTCVVFLPVPNSTCVVFLPVPNSTCLVSLPVPNLTCVVSLPVPNSTCVVSLPVPNLTCVVSLPVPDSTYVVFLPVPNSTCVVSLPVPNSTCVVFLPVPNLTCVVSLPVPDLTMKRATWGSPRIQRICNKADEKLLPIINNRQSIETTSNDLVKKDPDVPELKLLILAKEVMASNRSCIFEAARKVLNKYRTSLRTATDIAVFNAVGIYLELAICFTQGDVEAVNNILPEALRQAEVITPSRISAALYLLAALNLLQQKSDDDNSPALFATKALQHLKHVQDLPKIRADMEQKAHITLAMFYLGCDRFGMPTKDIDSVCLKKAESSIMAVYQSIYEGNPMNPFREAQFNIVQSILIYRKSQVQSDRKRFLIAAFKRSKKAETHATACNFQDIEYWSRNCMALFTEHLIRTHFQTPRS